MISDVFTPDLKFQIDFQKELLNTIFVSVRHINDYHFDYPATF